MTKYILHGGKTSKKSRNNERFFAEILKNLSGPVNLLIVYFASSKPQWADKFRQDKNNFYSNNPSKKINFVMASKNIITLVNQIKKADVIYIRGGRQIEEPKLIFSKIQNLEELFSGKVIAGSSAGAYFLSAYSIDSLGNLRKGLGILPIKVLGHYNQDRKHELKKLKNYMDKSLKTFPLKEGEFIVINH